MFYTLPSLSCSQSEITNKKPISQLKTGRNITSAAVYDLWRILFYCYVVFTDERTCFFVYCGVLCKSLSFFSCELSHFSRSLTHFSTAFWIHPRSHPIDNLWIFESLNLTRLVEQENFNIYYSTRWIFMLKNVNFIGKSF